MQSGGNIGTDQIGLLGSAFNFAPGSLAANNFVSSAAPAETIAGSMILYNSTTGQLFWDSDGTGARTPDLIANLTGAPHLAASDFHIL